MGSRPGVIIQARSTSTRLPRKWAADIGGVTCLDRVYRACKDADVGPVVFAIPEGDELTSVCTARHYLFVAGPLDDVLKRYAIAADAIGAGHVVRITADCILHNPDLIRMMVREHIDGGYDFTTNALSNRWPDGLDTEVISTSLLRHLDEKTLNMEMREHVTQTIYRHWEYYTQHYRLKSITWTLPLGQKYSLDTQEDLDRIRKHLEGTP